MLTGKTISQLDLLSNITDDTSIPVELSGNTYHVQYSSIKPYRVYTIILNETETVLTSGELVVGNPYVVTRIFGGDDFSNVGFVSENVPFIATNTTPINWSNNSSIVDINASQPVTFILEDNIGGINVSYDWLETEPGIYNSCIVIEKINTFFENKVFSLASSPNVAILFYRFDDNNVISQINGSTNNIQIEIKVYN